MEFKHIEGRRLADDSVKYRVEGTFPVKFKDFLMWLIDNTDCCRLSFVAHKGYYGMSNIYLSTSNTYSDKKWRWEKQIPDNCYDVLADKEIIACEANKDYGQIMYCLAFKEDTSCNSVDSENVNWEKCNDSEESQTTATSVFVDKPTNEISFQDIRNKTYSTLAAINSMLDTLRVINLLDQNRRYVMTDTLYKMRGDMLDLLALTYNINEDPKIRGLIALVNKSLADNSETNTLPHSLHKALVDLSNE